MTNSESKILMKKSRKINTSKSTKIEVDILERISNKATGQINKLKLS